jgi:hypothetical protein
MTVPLRFRLFYTAALAAVTMAAHDSAVIGR